MSDPHAHQEGITAAGHQHDAHGGHSPHELPFTEAEWQSLQASDLAAGRAIVTLLLGVFCIGVVLYTIVCYAVSS
jgi:hypothetical protein